MITSGPVYEEYQNRLCVNQDVFMTLDIATYHQFQHWCRKERRKLKRLRTAGNGRTGLIAWDSIKDEYRKQIKKAFGDPYQKDNVERFLARLENDDEAWVKYSHIQKVLYICTCKRS